MYLTHAPFHRCAYQLTSHSYTESINLLYGSKNIRFPPNQQFHLDLSDGSSSADECYSESSNQLRMPDIIASRILGCRFVGQPAARKCMAHHRWDGGSANAPRRIRNIPRSPLLERRRGGCNLESTSPSQRPKDYIVNGAPSGILRKSIFASNSSPMRLCL